MTVYDDSFWLPEKVTGIVLALKTGKPKNIVQEMMKCDAMKEEILRSVDSLIKKEVGQICSTKVDTTFRLSSPKELRDFDHSTLNYELQSRCPIFYQIIRAAAYNEKI